MLRYPARSLAVALAIGGLSAGAASGQSATVPMRPTASPVPDIHYPDAIRCEIVSPKGSRYSTIFYKSHVVSFDGQPNNVAEYGTPFRLDDNQQERDGKHRWRLQLGKPGNITALTLPAGWFSNNCSPGKSIASLTADKQTLKLFLQD